MTTSLVPSGDHWKLVTPLSRLVTRRGSPPDSGNSHTWFLTTLFTPGAPAPGSLSPAAGLADRNAIDLPSGLQRGLFDDCGAVVSAAASRLPSAGIRRISLRRRLAF